MQDASTSDDASASKPNGRSDHGGPRATHEGETYHVCSKTCKRAFEQTPAEFVMVDPTTAGAHDHH